MKRFFLSLLLFMSVSYGYSWKIKEYKITLPHYVIDSVLNEAIDSMINVERNCPTFTQDRVFLISYSGQDKDGGRIRFESYKPKYTGLYSYCIGYFYSNNHLFLIFGDCVIDNFITKIDKNNSKTISYFKLEGKDVIRVLIEPTIIWNYRMLNNKLIFDSKYNMDCK